MQRDEDLDASDDEVRSVDSVNITAVRDCVIEDDQICYVCATEKGEEVYDRSELMDGGRQQKLVLAFERKRPPMWDLFCPFCKDDGCEECECPDCERTCRFFRGINYGCEAHPVV